jgi:hypothetical protein
MAGSMPAPQGLRTRNLQIQRADVFLNLLGANDHHGVVAAEIRPLIKGLKQA